MFRNYSECRYLLSEKAMREMGIEALQSEFGPFTIHDVVLLLPPDDELSLIKHKLETERQLQSDKKDSKKRQKVDSSAVNRTEDLSTDAALNQSAPRKKLSKAESLVASAISAIDNSTLNSNVFKNLFHKDHEKDKYDRDLFMSVAGIRYTLR